MQRIARLTLAFAIAYAVLIITPAFLNKPFGPYPLMKTGDVTDLLTPIILIPLLWLLLNGAGDQPPTLRAAIAFMALAALWVLGQGMHLAANSIGHLLKDAVGTDAETLTHFYDEFLSHYLWHIGQFSLSALIIWNEWKRPVTADRSQMWLLGIAALIYGLAYFITTVEAVTWPLSAPFALGVAIVGIAAGRAKLRERPLLYFFMAASVIALIVMIGWGIRWGGTAGCESVLPEFSDACVGMIE